MPVYEYTCTKCGWNFEALVRPSDTKPQACPSCGSTETKKKLSVFAAKSGNSAQTCPHAAECPSGGSGHSCSCGCCHGH